ncbi:MAG: sensor histidine kinase [Magnetococcus sp. YQC-9]
MISIWQRMRSIGTKESPSSVSLQRDLAFGLAMALVVVMVCQWLLVSLAVQEVVAAYVVSRLEHDAENLLANLDLSTPDGPELLPGRVDPIYTQPWSGHYFQIQVVENALRSRSLWDAELNIGTDGPEGSHSVTIETRPWAPSLWRITRYYYKQGHSVVMIVAEEMSHLERIILLVRIGHAGISLLAIGVLLVWQRRALRRALAPLDVASEALGELEQGEALAMRTEGVFVEILPFVTAINRLLALLHGRLTRSRQAAGNMAHAIKTPLTVLMQLIDGGELQAHPELRGRMVRQIETIRALTGRELKKVRLAGAETPAGRVEMCAELRVLVDVMRRVHAARALRFESHLPDALSALIDREDLLELAGNLLDNACKWAHGVVRLSMTVDAAGGWSLVVEDDGPGCPSELFERILSRGGRVDGNGPGQGIGLAVVQEIAIDYSGRIELGRSEALGGFRVGVELPLKGVWV